MGWLKCWQLAARDHGSLPCFESCRLITWMLSKVSPTSMPFDLGLEKDGLGQAQQPGCGKGVGARMAYSLLTAAITFTLLGTSTWMTWAGSPITHLHSYHAAVDVQGFVLIFGYFFGICTPVLFVFFFGTWKYGSFLSVPVVQRVPSSLCMCDRVFVTATYCNLAYLVITLTGLL